MAGRGAEPAPGPRPDSGPEPPGLRRRLLAWVVGLVISAAFFSLAARGVEWRELWRALPGRDQPTAWLLVAAACAAGLLRMPARAARWRLLIRPQAPISFARLTCVTTLGTALDNLLPARAGDFGRAAVLRRDGLTVSGAFATIVVERMVDVLATQLLVVAALLIAPMPSWLFQAGLATCATAVAGLLVLALALRHRSRFEALLDAVGRRLPGPLGRRLRELAAGLLHSFLQGADGAVRSGHVPGLIAWSPVILLSNIVPNGCVLVACGLFDPAAAAGPAVVIATFTQFAVMLPAAPGQVGTVHFAGVAALSLFAVDAAPALACILLLHATQYLPVTVLGAPLIWREGLSAARRQRGE